MIYLVSINPVEVLATDLTCKPLLMFVDPKVSLEFICSDEVSSTARLRTQVGSDTHVISDIH